MIIAFTFVNNLNKFLDHLKSVGFELEEDTHIVLLDSSEFDLIICRKGNGVVAYIAIHYIDAHYAVLSELKPDADNSEILKVLLSVDRNRLWRIPVEPVIYVTNSYDFVRIMSRYADEIPREGSTYLESYLKSDNSIKNVINIDTLLPIAHKLSNVESNDKTVRS